MIVVANDELQGNHQVEIVKELSAKGYVRGYTSVKEFTNSLKDMEEWLKKGSVVEYEVPKTCILNKLIFDDD